MSHVCVTSALRCRGSVYADCWRKDARMLNATDESQPVPYHRKAEPNNSNESHRVYSERLRGKGFQPKSKPHEEASERPQHDICIQPCK
jgi:hypothetical protein